MWLKKEDSKLTPVKPIGSLEGVSVIKDGRHFRLCYQHVSWLNNRRREDGKRLVIGIPTFVSLDDYGDMHFYPAADQDYELEIYFHPPMDKQ